MGDELDRRSVLRAGGLLSLGAVLAACSGKGTSTAAPARTTTAGTTAAGTATAGAGAAATSATTTAAPTRSAVDLLAGAGTCRLTPETIAGPTWFDAHAVRRDIREDRPGTPLDLAFRVEEPHACRPVARAVVDLWQCDAAGVYSGFAGAAPGQGGSPGGSDEYGDPESRATTRERFLRGTQVTGSDGVVQFASIYPGWYPTRTAHLHLKVHLDDKTVLTTQLFFDDAVTDAVYTGSPYRRHAGRDTRNDRDAFYAPAAQLRLERDGARWLGAIVLGVP
jgi:protocatechuate 3,4-dioxygenase beta subunit